MNPICYQKLASFDKKTGAVVIDELALAYALAALPTKAEQHIPIKSIAIGAIIRGLTTDEEALTFLAHTSNVSGKGDAWAQVGGG